MDDGLCRIHADHGFPRNPWHVGLSFNLAPGEDSLRVGLNFLYEAFSRMSELIFETTARTFGDSLMSYRN